MIPNSTNIFSKISILLEVAKQHQKNIDTIKNFTEEDFNMFRICGVNHYENSHSSILAEFLNPKGSHRMKDTFLESFIKLLNEELEIDFPFDIQNASIHTEYSVKEGRIDILIKNPKQAIIIENKVYAVDQWEQLRRYSDFGKREFGEENFIILYLTLNGKDNEEAEKQNIEYHTLSYEENIIDWLEMCIQASSRKPILNATLIQYQNHLKKLTNQTMTSEINEELINLLAQKDNLEATFLIEKQLKKVKDKIIEEEFTPILEKVGKELGFDRIEIRKGDSFSQQHKGFRLFHSNWSNYYVFAQFTGKNYKDFIIGIGRVDKNARIVSDNEHKRLKKHFKRFNENNAFQELSRFQHWGGSAFLAIRNGEMEEELRSYFRKKIMKVIEEEKDFPF